MQAYLEAKVESVSLKWKSSEGFGGGEGNWTPVTNILNSIESTVILYLNDILTNFKNRSVSR
jgi:hypothetical protein